MLMKKGEIWLIELPFVEGREQQGIRPGIILADTKTTMTIVIPLTTHVSALQFPNTYLTKKSNKNNLEADSVALLFQIRALDKRRFIHKLGELEPYNLKKITGLLREMLEL